MGVSDSYMVSALSLDVIIQILLYDGVLVVYLDAHSWLRCDRPTPATPSWPIKTATHVQPVDHMPPSYNIYMSLFCRTVKIWL